MKRTFTLYTITLGIALTLNPIRVKSQLLCNLTFDNSSTEDFSGNGVHAINNGCTFVTDRHGNANSALSIQDNAWLEGLSTNFPLGDEPRSISIWLQMDASNISNAGVLFGYGGCNPWGSGHGIMLARSCSGGVCGLKIYSFGYGDDFNIPYNAPLNSWVHIVTTYNGSDAKIYVNGVLKGTLAKSWNTKKGAGVYAIGNSTPFSPPYANCQYLSNFYKGNVDDIRLYGHALTDEEVLDLYENNTTSIYEYENKNIEVYPNPAFEYIKITSNTVMQQIKLFDIQGSLVQTLDVSGSTEYTWLINQHLPKGIYFLQILNNKGILYTSKIHKI